MRRKWRWGRSKVEESQRDGGGLKTQAENELEKEADTNSEEIETFINIQCSEAEIEKRKEKR